MDLKLATIEDAEILSILNGEAQEIHADALPHLFKRGKMQVSLAKEILAKPENYVFIGYLDNSPVGYVYAAIQRREENPYRFALDQVYINQISVNRDHRGKGYGKILIDAVLRLAKEKGISLIALDVWAFNKNAKTFFSKRGFKICQEKMWLQME